MALAAVTPLAAELMLAGLQISRMWNEYAERAAAGVMTDEELEEAWNELIEKKAKFHLAMARQRAKHKK